MGKQITLSHWLIIFCHSAALHKGTHAATTLLSVILLLQLVTNSNQYEFVRQITVTEIFKQLQFSHKVNCYSNLSPRHVA